MSLRIAIMGTRGIPNRYGGFEQLASQLAPALVKAGHEVFVYSTHAHPYKETFWKGVRIVRCYDPSGIIGTAGQFVYDLLSILDAHRRHFDIILQLGYTSSSVWGPLFPAGVPVIYHLDGLEWQREKYAPLTRKFLRYAEKLAIRFGDFFITDSKEIQSYFEEKYASSSEYIAYGAAVDSDPATEHLLPFQLEPQQYCMMMARMEPENNIHMVLEGFCNSNQPGKILVVGDLSTGYGQKLAQKYASDKRVQFAGAIFDQEILHSLRHFCRIYFHGHSTGGTNPSLLEAMCAGTIIAAHHNAFNREVLGEEAFYFSSATEVTHLLHSVRRGSIEEQMIELNLSKTRELFRPEKIADQYRQFILQCIFVSRHERNLSHKRYSW